MLAGNKVNKRKTLQTLIGSTKTFPQNRQRKTPSVGEALRCDEVVRLQSVCLSAPLLGRVSERRYVGATLHPQRVTGLHANKNLPFIPPPPPHPGVNRQSGLAAGPLACLVRAHGKEKPPAARRHSAETVRDQSRDARHILSSHALPHHHLRCPQMLSEAWQTDRQTGRRTGRHLMQNRGG